MKLDKIVIIKQALDSYSKAAIKPRLAYKIMKYTKAINDEYEFYTKQIQELVQEYGEKDKDGNLITTSSGIQIKLDKINEFNDKINAVQDIEVDISNLDVSLDELLDIEGVSISPAQIEALEWITAK